MDSKDQQPSSIKEMSIFEHLDELRRRLFVAVLGVVTCTIVAYYFSERVFGWLIEPYLQAFPVGQLIGTGPAEAFLLKLKVAFFAGIVLSSPLIFFELWKFIAPGLYSREKRMVIPAVAATTAFFLFGIFFCYRFVLPFALRFFYEEYKSIGVSPAIRISEHIAMLTQALMGFGVVFQFPILAFLLGRYGIITHLTLIKYARYAIVAIFVVAAVMTPPDVLSQFLMAGPLLGLYGLSIVLLKWTALPPRTADDEKGGPDRP